jgi:hypothetical protein
MRLLTAACALILLCSTAPAWCAVPGEVDFTGAPIVMGARPAPLETLAARELQRYLGRVSGKVPQISTRLPARGPAILLGTPQSLAPIAKLAQAGAVRVSPEALGDEGFVLKVVGGARGDQPPRLVIAAASPRGVLWGVYALLERLGFGFTLGGDAFAGAMPPRLPADLDVTQRPAFAIRGSLPWYNFLDSPTTWDRDDYRYFFDQMAKMRMNFVGFHSYDHEPFCAYEENGKPVWGLPLMTAHNYDWWGGIRGMGTAEFGFGTGDFFFGPEFGSRAAVESRARRASVRACEYAMRASS